MQCTVLQRINISLEQSLKKIIFNSVPKPQILAFLGSDLRNIISYIKKPKNFICFNSAFSIPLYIWIRRNADQNGFRFGSTSLLFFTSTSEIKMFSPNIEKKGLAVHWKSSCPICLYEFLKSRKCLKYKLFLIVLKQGFSGWSHRPKRAMDGGASLEAIVIGRVWCHHPLFSIVRMFTFDLREIHLLLIPL